MTAYYIHDLDPYVFRLGETWGVRWYGLAYLAAFIAGYLLYRNLAKRGFSQLQPGQVGDFIFGGAIFGVILGGRLGYMIFYDWPRFVSDPLSFFRIYEGGMSAHGGILGLTVYSWWYARRHRVSWLNLGDNLVVVAPVGLFFGRLANFINGELYGRQAAVPWAVKFPKELYDAPPDLTARVLAATSALNPSWNTIEAVASNSPPQLKALLDEVLSPRHPSQLYEAFLEGALLFAVLWVLRTRVRLPDGALTGFFFLGYAVFRSFCEMFREPDAGLVGPLTRGQFLSAFLVLIGAAFLVAAWRKDLRTLLFSTSKKS